jgi:hypothetical protein
MEVALVPGWLGKIDWSNGLPIARNKFIPEPEKKDYWSAYNLSIYDELNEYRKFMSNKNDSYYHSSLSQLRYRNNNDWSAVTKKQNKYAKNKMYNQLNINYASVDNCLELEALTEQHTYLAEDDIESTTDMPLSLNEL